jgi:acylphosphatase
MTAPGPVRRRAVVRGQVQGVYFRDTVRQAAEERGVAGWARNRDDGAVEVVLEGPRDGVEAVIERCRTGPPEALVASVEVTEEPPQGLRGFGIA